LSPKGLSKPAMTTLVVSLNAPSNFVHHISTEEWDQVKSNGPQFGLIYTSHDNLRIGLGMPGCLLGLIRLTMP